MNFKKILTNFCILDILICNVIYAKDIKNKYYLINKVKTNNIVLVKNLLSNNNYNINLKDKSGNTALSYAIHNSNYDMVKLLLKYKADPKMRDSTKNYIYCSGQSSNYYKIKILFNKYDKNKCIKNNKKLETKAKAGFWNWKTIGAGALGIGGIAALAGGGGGSGGDNDSPSNRISPADTNYNLVGEVDNNKLDDILNNNQYKTDFSQDNFYYSNLKSFNDIRLAYSLARGYTGKVANLADMPYYLDNLNGKTSYSIGDKIKVAILDSGVQTNHIDLKDNISNSLSNTNLAYEYCKKVPTSPHCKGYNYQADKPDPTTNINDKTGGDSSAWHGTAVAGIIGASYSNNSGITGVAPDAELIPYRITFDDGSFVDNSYISMAFRYAADAGAVVINNSYGVPTIDADGKHNIDASNIHSKSNLINIYGNTYINNMLYAVNQKDVIFVWAAGNEGTNQPGVESAIPLYYNDFKNGDYYKNFITVVAYDSDKGNIANYSNRCGVAKEFCLTAPGTNLVSTVSTDNLKENGFYAPVNGTSFAAPMVSGAVAVLKGAFPYLTGADITKLLFITARDLGEKGVDEIYGWGMLDLERATRPVGTEIVPIDNRINSSSYNLNSTSLKLNSKLSNILKKQDLSFVFLDSFNRTFKTKLNNFIETEKERENTIDVLKNFGGSFKNISLSNDKSFNLYFNKDEDKLLYNEFEFAYTIDNVNDNNYGFNLYYGNNPYNAFIDDKINFYNNFSLSSSFGYNSLNPYFKVNSDNNFGFNNIIKLNNKLYLNFGALYQKYEMDYDQAYNNKKKDEELGSAFSFLTGITYDINKNISTKIETGFLNEFDTLFGSRLNGAFGIGDNNLTYIASIQNNINLFSNKLSLLGKANFGYTNINKISNSLVKDISGLFSNSFAIGLNYNFNNKINENRSNLSVLLVQPVKISSGNLKISLPIARDFVGNLYYDNHKISLKDEKEINLQIAYNHIIEKNSSLNLGFVYRNYIQNEHILLLKYKKNF